VAVSEEEVVRIAALLIAGDRIEVFSIFFMALAGRLTNWALPILIAFLFRNRALSNSLS
jgi:hypothetical protein